MENLDNQDYANLIHVINNINIKGSEAEYFALLKNKLEVARKRITDKVSECKGGV